MKKNCDFIHSITQPELAGEILRSVGIPPSGRSLHFVVTARLFAIKACFNDIGFDGFRQEMGPSLGVSGGDVGSKARGGDLQRVDGKKPERCAKGRKGSHPLDHSSRTEIIESWNILACQEGLRKIKNPKKGVSGTDSRPPPDGSRPQDG